MVKVKEVSPESANPNLVRILKGSITSILITVVLLIVYSAFLTYTNIRENTMPITIIIITGVSIFAGSLISSINIKKNGIVNGALVGLIYIAFIYLLSSIISKDFSLSTYSIIMIIASIVSGAVGGIVGAEGVLDVPLF